MIAKIVHTAKQTVNEMSKSTVHGPLQHPISLSPPRNISNKTAADCGVDLNQTNLIFFDLHQLYQIPKDGRGKHERE